MTWPKKTGLPITTLTEASEGLWQAVANIHGTRQQISPTEGLENGMQPAEETLVVENLEHRELKGGCPALLPPSQTRSVFNDSNSGLDGFLQDPTSCQKQTNKRGTQTRPQMQPGVARTCGACPTSVLLFTEQHTVWPYGQSVWEAPLREGERQEEEGRARDREREGRTSSK